jgi:hypothetical protein
MVPVTRMGDVETLAPGSLEARKSLARALAYRNRHVVDRFLSEYPIPRDEAEDIFRETKRWLWLCGKSGHSAALTVTSSMTVIDEMWHAFVLFTPDYAAYCERHFGRMLHHVPTTHTESARFFRRLEKTPDRVATEIGKSRRRQYEIVAEFLGDRTLRKWYVDFAERYSPRALARLRRQALRAS